MKPRRKFKKYPKRETVFIGIDGEGIGRSPHRYVMLCAKSETGNEYEVSDARGLGTLACLDFILSLPSEAKLFGFSFHYDLTKILAELPNEALYKLMRPEMRARRPGSKARAPYPVCVWVCDCNKIHLKTTEACPKCMAPRPETPAYKLNYQGTKFSVTSGKRTRIIWDVFRFYACKFTKALRDWKVLPDEAIAAIEAMKDKRGSFRKEDATAMTHYCFSECEALAMLVRKLVVAHKDAGLELKSFYGAGSTGAAILTQLGIGKLRREGPEDMTPCVSMAFFGGRFEHSVIGSVKGPVFSYDISSAYPYQTTFLPCLVHGRWSWTTQYRRMCAARGALVEYGYSKPIPGPWAPFPFRTSDGTIVFPSESGGGFVWRDEFLAGERLYPQHVDFLGAWVLESKCKCQPFRMIPKYYLNRIRLGKEGAGIVLKLGPNSVYGKLAQSVGQPPFQSWIWAGMITSGTRAQLLDLIGLHKNRANVLAVATDGLYSREDLKTPTPRDTGTFKAFGPKGEIVEKPLGGWEKKIVQKGVFFCRPGIYFPLHPTDEELDAVRARGIGRAAMHKAWQKLVTGYEQKRDFVRMTTLERFAGCKTSLHVGKKKGFTRSTDYGEWVERPVELSLSPLPKRSAVVSRHGAYGVLHVRKLDSDVRSAPYSRAVLSPEALLLRAGALEELEQPDADLRVWEDTESG
jgi:hypothetical protein